MRFAHVCLWASEFEQSMDFYQEVLGFDYSREFEGSSYQRNVHNYYIADESGTEIQFKRPVDGAEPPNTRMDHVAVEVDDVDRAVERIDRDSTCPVIKGATTLEKTNNRFAFVKDPNGYLVELVEFR
ncbi:VOC family protein [Natrarchaeobius chitinivorans]|uniref:VOC family protein n=1 Tax=Natrarchaeobius chitinivorans TaxID=1679083 RepID=A0A3N6M196_NATCH|nr:VOC family protein [Natrarchaeobius chitinivorans]RQG95437.1 VOC family protein [Natrarchaeobius chitinivorans]